MGGMSSLLLLFAVFSFAPSPLDLKSGCSLSSFQLHSSGFKANQGSSESFASKTLFCVQLPRANKSHDNHSTSGESDRKGTKGFCVWRGVELLLHLLTSFFCDRNSDVVT
mmetsp:Transcript_5211/g.8375  ORF Transcript_5211/g.8375 Transcript_5211/m.8375 type:complete len:110 (-) Transcript_5211:327-656(-)